MPNETKWEPGPWRSEIEYREGRVARVRVFAAKPRSVVTVTLAGLKRDRAGTLVPVPDAKVDSKRSDHPACVADCGIPYAGLAPETLVAHGDLIAHAPELYEAVAKRATILRQIAVQLELWSKSDRISCDRSDAMEDAAGKLRTVEREDLALCAKARGESADETS